MSNHGLESQDIEAAENDEMDPEYNSKPDEPKPNKGGRPKVSNFADLGTKMQRKRLEGSRDHVKKDAKENNLTGIQTVAEIGRQIANEEGDREKAKMFQMIANEQNPLAHRKMSVEQATAIKVF